MLKKFLSVVCLSLTFDNLLVSAAGKEQYKIRPNSCNHSAWSNNSNMELKDPNATVPALRCNFGHKPFSPEDPDNGVGCLGGRGQPSKQVPCTCMSEAQAIAHNQVTKDTNIGLGAAMISISALSMIFYLCWRRRKSKPVKQKVENSNKVNEEAENATGKKEVVNGKNKWCLLGGFFIWFLFFSGGIYLLVSVGILGSTDAYVCGCGSC